MRLFIDGAGRIADAVRHYLSRGLPPGLVEAERASDADCIVGTRPGNLGVGSLPLALEHRKHLLDLADLEPDDYLGRQEEIEACGITVIPGCGFCPGLVDFLVGAELATSPAVRAVHVRVGSLSRQPHHFPVLWCFEDMVAEFLAPSVQVVGGVERELPPFSGYRRERLCGIPAETYLCQSGFENLAAAAGVEEFTYRNVRPRGFREFFGFLHAHGLLEPDNLQATRELLEQRVGRNLSLALVDLLGSARGPGSRLRWRIVYEAAPDAELNSVQVITASFCLAVANLLGSGAVATGGLRFCEELGRATGVVASVRRRMRAAGVTMERRRSARGAVRGRARVHR